MITRSSDPLHGMDGWDAHTLAMRLEALRALPVTQRDAQLRELAWDYSGPRNYTRNDTVYRQTRDPEIARILLGQRSLMATHRYLGLGQEEALAEAREVEI